MVLAAPWAPLATDVADYLGAGGGVPFRRAHEIVGAIVRQSASGSAGEFRSLTFNEWEGVDVRFGEAIADAIMPRRRRNGAETLYWMNPAAPASRSAGVRAWLSRQSA